MIFIFKGFSAIALLVASIYGIATDDTDDFDF